MGDKMNKIKLDEYKQNKQYLFLFDILIKEVASNRDFFLEELDIAPSSYRRAKMNEHNISKQYIYKLSNYFGYKIIKENEIEKYQIFLNEIYNNFYYKIDSKFTYLIGKLEECISEKNLFQPIFMLFKLLLTSSKDNSYSIIRNESLYLLEEVKKYSLFFNNEMNEILDYIELLFEENIDNKNYNLNDKSALFYSALASKYCDRNESLISLFYASKAKEKYFLDANYKRLANLEFTIMSCYCNMKNYDKYYELAYKQFFNFKNLNNSINEYNLSKIHLAIAMLSLNKYNDILYMFNDIKDMSFSEVVCVLIAQYKVNKKEYYVLFNNLIQNARNNIQINDLEVINTYIENKDKKCLKKLSENSVLNILVKLLKELN